MLYDYFAHDAGGNQIAREGIDAATLKLHYSNLVVSGYRIKIRETGTVDYLEPNRFGYVLYY